MSVHKYTDKVMDHFRNPRNVGELEDADGIGKVGNPVCGDLMWIYIKVGKNDKGEEIIDDIRFKTFGCGSAVSTSSMITVEPEMTRCGPCSHSASPETTCTS